MVTLRTDLWSQDNKWLKPLFGGRFLQGLPKLCNHAFATVANVYEIYRESDKLALL